MQSTKGMSQQTKGAFFNAHEDVFTLVVVGYVLGAAMKILGMEYWKMIHTRKLYLLMYSCTIHVRRDNLLSVAGVIVNKNVDLSMSDCKEKLPSDRIYGYAKELLTLVLFYSEYSNAIRGGDGLRVLRWWSYLFPCLTHYTR